MTEPIVFISHFRIEEGKLEAYRRLQAEVASQLEADKPRTLVFLTYVNEGGSEMTAVNVFADAESMDLHVQGAGGEVASCLRVPGAYRVGGLRAAQRKRHPDGVRRWGSSVPTGEPTMRMSRDA